MGAPFSNRNLGTRQGKLSVGCTTGTVCPCNLQSVPSRSIVDPRDKMCRHLLILSVAVRAPACMCAYLRPTVSQQDILVSTLAARLPCRQEICVLSPHIHVPMARIFAGAGRFMNSLARAHVRTLKPQSGTND